MDPANPLPSHAKAAWRDGWFVVPYQVMFRDLDSFGHVNNAVFFTYFEWARTQLWFDLTGTSRADDIGFIVARAECNFRQQIRLEPIEIRVRVTEMRNTSFVFHTEIWRADGQQLAAEGDVTVVMYDWSSRSKLQIPQGLRDRINELQEG